MSEELNRYREEINKIDRQIIELLSRRFEYAGHIAREKKKDNSPLYRPDREQQIFKKIAELNPGIVDNSALQNIYREIMSATIHLEGSLQIAYLGPEGSFSHEAALKKFGHSLDLLPQSDIFSVFEAVAKKKARYGIVPVENSIEGMVNVTLDALLEFDLKIYAEVYLPIHHQLVGFASDLAQIREVYTHPQPQGQCRQWLARNLPNARWHETLSTSQAIRQVCEWKDPARAAIGSRVAAELYGGTILTSDIEDQKRNYTRFIVIGHDQAAPSLQDRTSVIFTLPHRPGALQEALNLVAAAGVNLTSIESRPSHNELWSYFFYIDFEGHRDNSHIDSLLSRLNEKTTSLRILGSYPVDTQT